MILRRKRRIDVRKCAWVAAVIAAACMFGFGMGSPAGSPLAGVPGKAPVVTTSD